MSKEKDHIDLGPLSDDTLKRTPFSVEDNYFQQLEDKLLCLSEEEPKLDFPKSDGFTVPPSETRFS